MNTSLTVIWAVSNPCTYAQNGSRTTWSSSCGAPHIHTLDLGHLYWRAPPLPGLYPTNQELPLLPALPHLASLPRVIHFCSWLDHMHIDGMADDLVDNARATRFPFATLLRGIDVSTIEQLEIGAEALSLPSIVAYTWSSLRELIITGFWIHNNPELLLDDARLETPASIYRSVHLGTFLNAAPYLRVLRVRCRYNTSCLNPGWTVWPPGDDSSAPSTIGHALEVFELYNPSTMDGVYSRLPSTLRTLALLTHLHGTHETLALGRYELLEDDPMQPHTLHVFRPMDAVRVLSAAPLPNLRDLRLSFREEFDSRLFDFIAKAFPLLEILELHSEAGPGCIWRASEVAACAQSLSPLAYLRSLRLNTFRTVLSEEGWRRIQKRTIYHETLEQKTRAGVRKSDIVAALFTDSMRVDEPTEHDARSSDYTHSLCWPHLRDVWLPVPDESSCGMYSYMAWRSWRIYIVHRDCNGRADLRESSRPSFL
ncbi:hypothetical protein HDZ31DRAFT_38975 [Schizophyllum fasciatum]